MEGYILEITEDDSSVNPDFFSGSIKSLHLPTCSSPSCGKPMFPVINIREGAIDTGEQLNEKFFIGGYITFDVCASCSHALRNYHIAFDGNKKTVVGGYKDNNGCSNKMDFPYENRAIKISNISDQKWSDECFIDSYHQRKLFDGVCHQFGGEKLKLDRVPIDSCMCCGGELNFVAMIDNDDLNVPLYENGEPRELVIGDQKSLNVFACNKCVSLNYCITE